MPAPTALRRQEGFAQDQSTSLPQVSKSCLTSWKLFSEQLSLSIDSPGDVILVDATTTTTGPLKINSKSMETDVEMQVDEEGRPNFPPSKNVQKSAIVETRKVLVPPHRITPLKASWSKIYPPLVEHLKLQVRMNVKSRAVELRTSKHTIDTGALQKGEDFVKAFSLGFEVDDAIALLRLDDLYIETFEIKDVKTLNGEHLGRAIGRIAGKDGKTKFAIENASRTRVVLADQKIHILGGFKNVGLTDMIPFSPVVAELS